jgi:transcriptional regulator with XRE-family HTH domain
LTQDQLAEKLGIDQSTYSKLERNPKTITVEQAEKLAALYGVSVADLPPASITISFSNNTIDKAYVHNLNESDSKEAARAKDSKINSLKQQIE